MAPCTKAIADSGTTGHYLPMTSPSVNKTIARIPLPVHLPNGTIIHSTHTALLPITSLPPEARHANLFPDIKHALISIGTLCDNGCLALFDDKRVYIFNRATKKCIMMGERDKVSTLYMLELDPAKNDMTETLLPEHFFANHVFESKTKVNLAKFFTSLYFLQQKLHSLRTSNGMLSSPGQDSQQNSLRNISPSQNTHRMAIFINSNKACNLQNQVKIYPAARTQQHNEAT